jgi:hypothetical protein
MDLHRKQLGKSRKLKFGKLILLFAFCFQFSAFPQTGSINVDENHNGHKIFGLPTPTAGNEAATKAYADSVGGGGGGSGTVTSITATTPIVVTPSPLVTTGVISLTGTSYGKGFLSLVDAAAARTYIGALNSANVGDLIDDHTDPTPSGINVTGGTGAVIGSGTSISQHVADTTHNGFLSSSNWNTFNSKQNGDGDLTAIAALTGTNTIYYRSAADTWSPVTIGGNMTFSGGTLNSTAGGSGTVTTTGSPATGNLTKFSGATSITNGDLSGNVTTSGTLATTIANSAVTYAKMQNVSASSVLLGSSASGSGAPPSEIALGTNLSMSGSTLNATGGGGGNVSNSGTPAVNQVATWTDSTHVTGSGTLVYNNPGATGVLTIGGTDVGISRNAAGILEVDTGTPGSWSALKIGAIGTGTATVDDGLIIGHNVVGTPGSLFGTGIMLNAEDSTTNDVNIGELQAFWQGTPTHGSARSDFAFRLNNSAAALSVAAFIHGNGIIDATSGYQINNSSAASGKILQGDGIKFATSTPTWPTAAGSSGVIVQSNGANLTTSAPTWPTASGTSGVIVQSNGTNLITSTPTWPTAAGAVGYTVRSDATNFASFPAQLINSSTASQSPSTSDVYLTGSNIVVTAGDMKAKGQYKCVFDMTKSAGTGAIVITLRVGTAGSTSDPAIQTYTFGAGTSVADTGIFEVIATWRTVGSGTSAVMQGICRGTHQLATTGLFNNAGGWVLIGSPSPSSGFNSSTATNIGLSFNGSTAFAGTTTLVQAQLQQ